MIDFEGLSGKKKSQKMVLLTNKYQYHNLMLENFLDEWVTKKRPDVVLHSNDGHNFKVYALFVTSKIEFSNSRI